VHKTTSNRRSRYIVWYNAHANTHHTTPHPHTYKHKHTHAQKHITHLHVHAHTHTHTHRNTPVHARAAAITIKNIKISRYNWSMRPWMEPRDGPSPQAERIVAITQTSCNKLHVWLPNTDNLFRHDRWAQCVVNARLAEALQSQRSHSFYVLSLFVATAAAQDWRNGTFVGHELICSKIYFNSTIF